MIDELLGTLEAVAQQPVPVEDALDITPWLPLIGGVILAVIGGLFGIANRRGGEAARRAPTWVELATENRLLREDLKQAADELRAARRAIQASDELEADLTDLRREFEEFADQVEARDRVNMLAWATAAEQWPAGTPGPTFDHIVDLDVIDDTLPPAWRRGTPRA